MSNYENFSYRRIFHKCMDGDLALAPPKELILCPIDNTFRIIGKNSLSTY